MLGTLIGLVILCIVLGVCWWAAQRLLALIPLGEPFRTIVDVLVVLVGVLVVLWVLVQLLGVAGVHVPFPR